MLLPLVSPQMRRPTPAELRAPLGQTRFTAVSGRWSVVGGRWLSVVLNHRLPTTDYRPPELLRVQLHDQLLLDGHRDVVARRRGLDGALEAALVEVEPGRDAAAVDCLERLV